MIIIIFTIIIIIIIILLYYHYYDYYYWSLLYLITEYLDTSWYMITRPTLDADKPSATLDP